MSFLVCGSQTTHAYSRHGRTIVLYARSFMFAGEFFSLCLSKPSFHRAEAHNLRMWEDHVRLLVIVTPRYLKLSVREIGRPLIVY